MCASHDTVEACEAAGFRACQRCRPRDLSVQAEQAARITRACRLIETAEVIPSLARLAEAAGLSPHHFHRLFKARIGLTPAAYAKARRAQSLRTALASADSVTTAFHDAGFGSSGRFYAQAGDLLGMQPATYRTGGRRETIRFAIGACSLGSVLVASSERGVCAILLGDDPQALIRDLEGRFPYGALIGGDTDYETRVATVLAVIENPALAPSLAHELPLDIRGTAFQQRVWQALSAIPAGHTVSYTELARLIGLPAAARAVAGACAANALAVVIPCHRVVRADGGLSGYRWGVERKRTLLDRESMATTAG